MKFGVELEGGWDANLIFKLKSLKSGKEINDREIKEIEKYVKDIKGDGSIYLKTFAYDENVIAKEITTKVFEYSNFREFEKFMQKIGKYIREVNESMGYHIHFSFNEFDKYILLLSCDFLKKFKRFLKKEFDDEVKKRFNNNYCREIKNYKNFMLKCLYNYSRYYFINYRAWERHKTFEVRILNMRQDFKILTQYTKKILDFIYNYVKEKKINFEKKITIKKISLNTLNIKCAE